MRRRIRLLATCVVFCALPLWVGASFGAPVSPDGHGGETTTRMAGIDHALDLLVARRVAVEHLSPAAAAVARDQLAIQFAALTRAEQQTIAAVARGADAEEAASAALLLLNESVQESARTALAAVQAAYRANVAATGMQGMGKIASNGDLVFVATAGPCRIYDSRNGPGALPGGASTQVYAWSDNPFYTWSLDQGGTGTAGSGNCAGTVYPGGVTPVSVVATITVLNTQATGALRAWDGGPTLVVGAALAWNPGDRMSNTTVIPTNRFTSAYPGSGLKRDIGINDNSAGSIDFVIDVVGYYIQNQAAAFDCTVVSGASVAIPANSTTFANAPSCPAGYSTMTSITSLGDGRYTSSLSPGSCRMGNLTGAASTGTCSAYCCRVQGR